MKKSLFSLFLLYASVACYAQDIIHKTNAQKIDAKIIEVSKQEVKYKESNYIDGPTFILETSEIDSITYANGTVIAYTDRIIDESTDTKNDTFEIKPDPHVVGKSHLDWHNYLDYIHIYKTIHIDDFSTIYILPIDYTKVTFPNKEDNRYEAMVNGINNFPDIIQQQIIKRIPKQNVVILREWPTQLKDNSLCLQVSIEQIDMGSRALRFWIGFGAGAQSVKIAGKVFSNKGEEFFNFNQKRLSSKGGAQFTYQRVLESEFENLGKDMAKIFINMEKDDKVK